MVPSMVGRGRLPNHEPIDGGGGGGGGGGGWLESPRNPLFPLEVHDLRGTDLGE